MERDLVEMIKAGVIDFSNINKENRDEELLKQILIGFLKPLCLFEASIVQFADDVIVCKGYKNESKIIQNSDLVKAFYNEYRFIPLEKIKLEKDIVSKTWQVYIKFKDTVKGFKSKGLTEGNSIKYEAKYLFEVIYQVFKIEVIRAYS